MNETIFQVNNLSDLIAIVVFIVCAFKIGLTSMIFFFYSRSKHKYLPHITLMSGSHLVLLILVAMAMNFRVFYSGNMRLVACIAALIGVLMGFAGLILIFNRRQKDLITHDVLVDLKNHGHLTDDAVKDIERSQD